MRNGKIWFFVLSFLMAALILYFIWRPDGLLDFNNPEDIANVAVEFHGMIFDIFLFGIILTLYELFSDRKQRIQRYKDEISDFRYWDEKEASYRVVGNIKRLNEDKIYNIDLESCYLHEAQLDSIKLNKSNLSRSNLSEANLSGADLRNVSFREANLRGADLSFADLRGANLTQADLSGANLDAANLEGTQLGWAKLPYVNLNLARNLTEKQLSQTLSLYECKNLDSKLETNLRNKRPHLFTEEGRNIFQ